MEISTFLKQWYAFNMRPLPWRNSKDPYVIWVSEVILQQTRIAQGTAYFKHFLETFPDISILAASRIEDVLLVWQGLGYYSRARNMHATARTIMTEHGGTFPGTYNELIQLKGIGPYTAAAISSIAFGEARAVVSGNNCMNSLLLKPNYPCPLSALPYQENGLKLSGTANTGC